MDISKLTIQGFKSFYEKSTFSFDKNITGIVGPNGSGKSNITEAIRFVLGEQSTKSMRGKDSTDLLFRGNSVRASKASVTVEFTKNKYGKNKLGKGDIANIFVKNALEKDIVTVSRTIYQDGKSEYQMNGVEVRLKDLTEFLLYIHLGNKSNWHISQGEADRVLLANSTERKALIEDALGLKVYHSRINDSARKMEKTKENIREATIKRKEILPELNVLQRTVERIKRSNEFRVDLQTKASIYLDYKHNKILELKNTENEGEKLEELKEKLISLEQEISLKEKSLYKDGSHDISFLELEQIKEEKVINILKNEVESLNAKFRSSTNNFDYLAVEEEKNLVELKNIDKELQDVSNIGNDIIFSEQDINQTKDYIETNTEKIVKENDLDAIKNLAKDTDFNYKKLIAKGSVVNKDNVKQISYLQGIKSRIQEKLKSLKIEKDTYKQELEKISPELDSGILKLKISNERLEEIKKQILEFKYHRAETENSVQKLIFSKGNLENKILQKNIFANKIVEMEHELESDGQELKAILGQNFTHVETEHKVENEEDFLNLKRNIERLKIRLEESIVQNPDEVVKNFDDMTEKDNFLVKEISDLENSMINLEKLIAELKENLKQEFSLGLKHIDTVFDSYVKKLFGGGSAKVFVVEIESKKKSDDEEGESDEEKEETRTGVEVEVTIPNKKVKGMQSLSGGERALVSIALNFSIIHQNPSPFMILDETDATLDEANAKRYGEILSILKDQTKLIVVTHNRETMHFADQVYGVTLSKEGHSKVLSVSFEDAVEYAK